MADLSDVTFYLYQQATAAVYPNGTSSASAGGLDCRIYEGWPLGDQLDLDMAGNTKDATGAVVPRVGGPVANVSIFPMPGTGRSVYQILDETYTIVPPAYGMSVSVVGNVITVSGQPNTGEYLTIVADRENVYSQTGATTAAILSSLAGQIAVQYPSVGVTTTTLTIPFQFALTVRQGAVATQGKVTHRQCHEVMITVWAPNRVARSQLASAIDVALKPHNIITLPDTSQAKIVYSRTMVNDQEQAQNIYRRDLIYEVEYSTLQTFPAYVVTTVNITLASANGAASTNVIV